MLTTLYHRIPVLSIVSDNFCYLFFQKFLDFRPFDSIRQNPTEPLSTRRKFPQTGADSPA